MDLEAFVSDLACNSAALWPVWGLIAGAIGLSTIVFYGAERERNRKVTSWLTALYFTLVCCTTIGFGDIRPRTTLGRVLAILNGCIGLIAFGTFVAVVTASLEGNIG